MIRIGEFASIFDVTNKTIRLYEEKGLLTPCLVDAYTGYRYYDDQNITEMTKILVLKDLGLSLKEIKEYNFDSEQIEKKINEYKKQVNKFKRNIDTLKSLSESKEVIKDMKIFINDEDVIGKWKLLGISDTTEDAHKGNFVEDDFNIKELYFLPDGEGYWVISWTKGTLFLRGIECAYSLKGDKMYLNINDPYDNSFYKIGVYEKVDSKEYSVSEIQIKDDTDLEFVEDSLLKGCWKSVDFIGDKNLFKPGIKQYPKKLFLEKIIVSSDNDCLVLYSTDEKGAKQIKYTKDYLINLCIDNTVSKYEHITIDNEKYIIVEWKSGDYVFGGMVRGYYILKKID